jgi:hypothetical protein
MATTHNMRRLGFLMESIRKRSGRSLQSIDRTKITNQKSLQKLERGKIRLNWTQVVAVATEFGATSDEVARVKSLALRVDEPGDWESYRSGIPDFPLFLSLEGSAREIWVFDPELVTGLFQTEAYAHAVVLATGEDEEEARTAAKSRQERREKVFGHSPGIVYIATEGALRRQVGGPEVHDEQIDMLRFLSNHADIRVIPDEVGAYPAMNGGYTVLRFDSPEDRNTVYVESPHGCMYVDAFGDVDLFEKLFQRQLRAARPLAEVMLCGVSPAGAADKADNVSRSAGAIRSICETPSLARSPQF